MNRVYCNVEFSVINVPSWSTLENMLLLITDARKAKRVNRGIPQITCGPYENVGALNRIMRAVNAIDFSAGYEREQDG